MGSMEGGLEGGWGKKGGGGNNAIVSGRGGEVLHHQGRAHVRPPRQQCHHDSSVHLSPPGDDVVMTDGGAGGKEGTVEL
jgi:hypothetical protein